MFTFKELLQLYYSTLACFYFEIALRHENAWFVEYRVGKFVFRDLKNVAKTGKCVCRPRWANIARLETS